MKIGIGIYKYDVSNIISYTNATTWLIENIQFYVWNTILFGDGTSRNCTKKKKMFLFDIVTRNSLQVIKYYAKNQR